MNNAERGCKADIGSGMLPLSIWNPHIRVLKSCHLSNWLCTDFRIKCHPRGVLINKTTVPRTRQQQCVHFPLGYLLRNKILSLLSIREPARYICLRQRRQRSSLPFERENSMLNCRSLSHSSLDRKDSEHYGVVCDHRKAE